MTEWTAWRARRSIRATAALLGVVMLGACGSGSTAGDAPRGRCPTAPVPVVVSVDQWGDIVGQLAGDCGAVTTIFKSSSADPHDYEPTPADTAKFSEARLVVVNGLDYDPWADKAVATLDTAPIVVNAGKIVGRENGDNPHLWYGPSYVYKVADAVTAKLQQLEPEDAQYFAHRHDAWRASMRPYDAEIAKVTQAAHGKSFAATEGIFDDMAHAVGLADVTPHGFATATANESEPAPGDVNDFEHALASRDVDVLLYNTQTQGAVPEQLRSRARRARIPVVDVTESVPPQFRTFEAWQVRQLQDLATALGRVMDALTLEAVSAARDADTIWSDGSFSVPKGSVVAIIGPNGSGKTTFLHMILGLIEPAAGRLTVFGEAPRRGNPRIGYVPQNYTAEIGEAIRCRDLVTLGRTGTRWGFGTRSAVDRSHADAALRSVSALDVAGRRVSEISGGQQQRVAIAQALVGDPELLLLDEPLANLDIRNQHEIVQLLRDLHTERDVTILVVVHDLNPMLSILDGAIYLLDGHAHYGAIGDVVDGELLTHLYDTPVKVVRTAQGDLFTRS